MSRHTLTFLVPIFYLFMLTHDHVRKVTSVIISPWKCGKRAEIRMMYASIVVLEDKQQLCPGLLVLTASDSVPVSM